MKQAVVLILDANSSMAASYDDGNTRFECAKRVAQNLICDLMIQSKTHEVGVIVLKSPKTYHHFHEEEDSEGDEIEQQDLAMPLVSRDEDDLPFPNILEMGGDGNSTWVRSPTPTILRKINNLQVTKDATHLRGDFCDGIIVATDSLHRRTNKKKFQRRIVLITDAEHKVEVDPDQLQTVLEGLKDLECPLNVIGIDFEKEANFDKPEPVPSNEDANEDSDTDMGSDTDGEEEEDIRQIKSQNEALLISLTSQTGGYVMAAKELTPVLDKVLGKRQQKATRRKFEFEIAPGLCVEARYSKILAKNPIPRLKKLVVAEDHENNDDTEKYEKAAQPETFDFTLATSHFDAEDEKIEIDEIGDAYRYGSDLVPMSGYDMAGLKTISAPKIKILGYLPETQVPLAFRTGPPYVLSGADSRKACAAISAMARALHRKQHVAIATFVKTKDSAPCLAGIFPLVKQGGKDKSNKDEPIHLIVFQLPFRGDVSGLTRSSLEAHDKSKEKVCDDLISALRLDDDELDHSKIANPLLRSYWKTVIDRVNDEKSPVASIRSKENDQMNTSCERLERAKPALKAFYDAFPMAPRNHLKAAAKK